MSGVVSRTAGRFRRNERGAVLLIFVLVFLPMMLAIAIAIDYSQFLVMKRQLGNAVDAAALNLAQASDLTQEEADQRARAYLEAHYTAASIGKLGTVAVTLPTLANPEVTVQATATMPTTFMKMGGVDKLDVAFSGSAIRKESMIELVMVLDNSGSMAGSRISALKTAANEMVDTLFAVPDAEKYVRIGLVPFTAAVNVGSAYRNAAWMDTTGASPIQRESIDLRDGETLFTLFDELNVSWAGCVRARAGDYALRDTPPNPGIGESLFVPYFSPDEPSRYNNSYIPDTRPPSPVVTASAGPSAPDDCAAAAARIYPTANDRNRAIQRCRSKYYRGATVTSAGPNNNCVGRAIQPLTNDPDIIRTAVNGMVAGGNTVIPHGVIWGWHLVSPNEPFPAMPYLPASPSDPTVIKAIVVLSDGQNAINGGSNGHNGSIFNAFGFANESPHFTSSGSPEAQLDDKLRTMCSNIKADQTGDGRPNDILIYTIALGIGRGSGVDRLLEGCATSAAMHFNSPRPEDLRSAFQSIAIGLNQLRISR